MPDYQNAKIYKIYSYENDEVYYGSTCDTLCRRMTGHRSQLKRYKEGKIKYYCSSFKILELTSYKIELVENYFCNSKEELLQREGYYIRNNDCVNKCIPNRTIKEYNATNKDKMKEYNKEYRQKNKDKMKEYNKEYQEQNKDKIKEYKREYKEQNKDKIKEQNKEYKEQNKDKIKEYMREYRQRKKEQQLLNIQDTNINKI